MRIRIDTAKSIIAMENMSRCRSQAALKTGIWIITKRESSAAERASFFIMAFPTEKIDTAKMP
jgi:hypothetical protein